MVREARSNDGATGGGIESKMLQLKRNSLYDFIHSIQFPNQSNDAAMKSHIFKMSTMGPGSGVDIVERMRRTGNGDLKRAWVCFDHVKRISEGWTTMAAHVYNPS